MSTIYDNKDAMEAFDETRKDDIVQSPSQPIPQMESQSQKRLSCFQTNLYLELLAGFGLHTSGPVEVNVLSVLASRTETELCFQKETWWASRCSGNPRPILKFSDYSVL